MAEQDSLRNKLTVWYASAMWKGKSLEEISKLPDSNLQNGEENITELMRLIEHHTAQALENAKSVIKTADTYTFEDGTKVFGEKALTQAVREAFLELKQYIDDPTVRNDKYYFDMGYAAEKRIEELSQERSE